jgi:transposase
MLTDMLPALLPDFGIDECRVTATKIIFTLASLQLLSVCPVCSLPAHSVHSEYSRTLCYLPCCGIPVVLRLKVRKLFCHNRACKHKIFTE